MGMVVCSTFISMFMVPLYMRVVNTHHPNLLILIHLCKYSCTSLKPNTRSVSIQIPNLICSVPFHHGNVIIVTRCNRQCGTEGVYACFRCCEDSVYVIVSRPLIDLDWIKYNMLVFCAVYKVSWEGGHENRRFYVTSCKNMETKSHSTQKL